MVCSVYCSSSLRWPFLSGIMMFFSGDFVAWIQFPCVFCVSCFECYFIPLFALDSFKTMTMYNFFDLNGSCIPSCAQAHENEIFIEQITFGDYFVAVQNDNKKGVCVFCVLTKNKSCGKTEHWTPRPTITSFPFRGRKTNIEIIKMTDEWMTYFRLNSSVIMFFSSNSMRWQWSFVHYNELQ